jgi:hypothetical protein
MSPQPAWTGDTKKNEKERQFADGRREGGGGCGAELYDARKLSPLNIIQYSLDRVLRFSSG